MTMFRGVYSVLPTPFAATGQVDLDSLDRIVDLYLNAGVDGLTVLGVTSEVGHLTEAERSAILARVARRAGARVSIVAGASGAGTLVVVENARAAVEMGVAGVMVSPPRMAKLNSSAVVQHYSTLAEEIDVPIVLQDFPPESGFTMEPELIARIAKEVPSVRTVKLEDPPTPVKTARILEAAGPIKLSVLGGLGGGFLLEELFSGASGAMTGFAYPEILLRVVSEFNRGDVPAAAETFYRCVPIMRFEFQAGIGMALRKEILRRRGAIAHAGVRPPRPGLDRSTLRALDSLLEWISRQEDLKWISA